MYTSARMMAKYINLSPVLYFQKNCAANSFTSDHAECLRDVAATSRPGPSKPARKEGRKEGNMHAWQGGCSATTHTWILNSQQTLVKGKTHRQARDSQNVVQHAITKRSKKAATNPPTKTQNTTNQPTNQPTNHTDINPRRGGGQRNNHCTNSERRTNVRTHVRTHAPRRPRACRQNGGR